MSLKTFIEEFKTYTYAPEKEHELRGHTLGKKHSKRYTPQPHGVNQFPDAWFEDDDGSIINVEYKSSRNGQIIQGSRLAPKNALVVATSEEHNMTICAWGGQLSSDEMYAKEAEYNAEDAERNERRKKEFLAIPSNTFQIFPRGRIICDQRGAEECNVFNNLDKLNHNAYEYKPEKKGLMKFIIEKSVNDDDYEARTSL